MNWKLSEVRPSSRIFCDLVCVIIFSLCLIFNFAPLYAKSAEGTEKSLNATEFLDTNDRALVDVINLELKKANKDHCNKLIPLFEELLRRPSFERKRPIIALYAQSQMWCANSQYRPVDAFDWMLRLESETNKSMPGDSIAFGIAASAQKFDEAMIRLQHLALDADSSGLLSIDTNMIYSLMQYLKSNNRQEDAHRIFFVLYRSPHFNRLDADLRSTTAATILTDQLATKSTIDLETLVPQLIHPPEVRAMLIYKKFEPIWNALEEHAGRNMRHVVEAELRRRKADFEINPHSQEALKELAFALLHNGDFDEVIKIVRENLPRANQSAIGWTRDEISALEAEAYAHDALGDHKTADLIFEQIAKIPYDPSSNQWLLKFLLDRTQRLLAFERWEEALDSVQYTQKVLKNSVNPIAQMFVRRDLICALSNLGRENEINDLLNGVREHQADSYSLATSALLCAGEIQEAADLAEDAMRTHGQYSGIAEDIQAPGTYLAFPFKRNFIRDELLRIDGVNKEFQKIARDLPKELWPVGAVKIHEMLNLQESSNALSRPTPE